MQFSIINYELQMYGKGERTLVPLEENLPLGTLKLRPKTTPMRQSRGGGVGVAARPGTPLARGREVGSAAGRRVNGSSAVKTHQHQSEVSS